MIPKILPEIIAQPLVMAREAPLQTIHTQQAPPIDAPFVLTPQPPVAPLLIYSAIYSGVPVYEVVIREMPIMRRMGDSYMNATQILKMAGFAKPRRTKILEQEVLSGLHEKIQGGYGKYQGTWIPMETGRALAMRYGVDEILSPILNFNPDVDFVGIRPHMVRKPAAPKPTAAQIEAAMRNGTTDLNALARQRSMSGFEGNSGMSQRRQSADISGNTEDGGTVTPPNGTGLGGSNDYSSHASQSFSNRFGNHSISIGENALAKRTPARSRVASSATILTSPVDLNSMHQEATPHYVQDHSRMDGQFNPLVSRRLFDEDSTQHQFFSTIYTKRKTRIRTASDFVATDIDNYDFAPSTATRGLSVEQKKKEILMCIFTQEDNGLNNAYVFELLRSTEDASIFNTELPLDHRNSQALHWAAACGRLNLVRLLIMRGGKAINTADDGETPLIRAINNISPFTERCMPDLIRLLAPSFLIADAKKSTALHHIANLSKVRSKRVISQYYMQSAAAFIVEFKSAQNCDAFIDSGDESGDTALHIACRHRNHALVYSLLSIGASKTIENLQSETPTSLSAYDPRLKKLMYSLPDPEFDDYLDAPTTPVSDMSEDPEVVPDFTQNMLDRKQSSSSLSSLNGIDLTSTAAQLSNSKMYMSELKQQKDRFDVVLKCSAKIQAQLERPSTPTRTALPLPTDNSSSPLGAPEDHQNKRQRLDRSPRSLLQETKLHAQLSRLDTQVKSSVEEQGELLKRIDLIRQERVLKDDRYTGMISKVCRVSQAMDEILVKLSE